MVPGLVIVVGARLECAARRGGVPWLRCGVSWLRCGASWPRCGQMSGHAIPPMDLAHGAPARGQRLARPHCRDRRVPTRRSGASRPPQACGRCVRPARDSRRPWSPRMRHGLWALGSAARRRARSSLVPRRRPVRAGRGCQYGAGFGLSAGRTPDTGRLEHGVAAEAQARARCRGFDWTASIGGYHRSLPKAGAACLHSSTPPACRAMCQCAWTVEMPSLMPVRVTLASLRSSRIFRSGGDCPGGRGMVPACACWAVS